MEIYCRFTIIDYKTWIFLSLECVCIFLADPVFIGINIYSFVYSHTRLSFKLKSG